MVQHWNVLRYTCGLMEDSSLLIESICDVFVAKKMLPIGERRLLSYNDLYDHQYLSDLNIERSTQSTNPFDNTEIFCMHNEHLELGQNRSLYYFYGTREYHRYKLPLECSLNHITNPKPCIVIINEAKNSLFMQTTVNACAQLQQPVRLLQINGFKYYNSGESMQIQLINEYFQDDRFVIPPRHLTFYPGAAVCINQCWLQFRMYTFFSESLAKCNTLSKLALYDCREIPIEIMSALKANSDLTYLEVSRCSISEDALMTLVTNLRLLTKLEHLVIEGIPLYSGRIRDSFRRSFQNLKNLKSVSLISCNIWPPLAIELMKLLSECPLERLDLSGNILSGVFQEMSILSALNFQHLKCLGLRVGSLSEADILGLAQFIKNDGIPLVQEIELTAGDQLLDKQNALEVLAQRCEFLSKTHPCRIKVRSYEIGSKLKKKRYKCFYYL